MAKVKDPGSTIQEDSKKVPGATLKNRLYNVEIYCYIAGIQIPVNTFAVHSAFSQLPKATITVPAHPYMVGLGNRDRVPIQIFIRDSFNEKSSKYTFGKEVQTCIDKILLFDGEIVSTSYNSTGVQRSFSIEAESNMIIMKDMNILNVGDIDSAFLNSGSAPTGDSSEAKITNPSFTYPWTFFLNGLPLNAEEAKNSSGPLRCPGDLLDNIVKFIELGDIKDKSAARVFYEKYSKEIKFKERVAFVPIFDGAHVSFKDKDWPTPFGDSESKDAKAFPPLVSVQNSTTINLLMGMATPFTARAVMDFIVGLLGELEYDISVLSSPMYNGKGFNQVFLKPIMYEALPPKCNILFKSQLISLSVNETVHGLPTRIIASNLTGVISSLNNQNNDVLSQVITTYTYPKKNLEELKNSPIVTPLEESERKTGPFVQRTSIPGWVDRIDFNMIGNNTYFAEHMYRMATSGYKGASVVMAFNPYIVPGFPTLILDDTATTDAVFVAFVTAVSHSINVAGVAQTNVELAFPRLYLDELADPLNNTVKEITDVTHNIKYMSLIYNHLLGCEAIDIYNPDEIRALLRKPYKDPKTGKTTYPTPTAMQTNPRDAYVYNYRPIVTLEQYYDTINGGDSWRVKNNKSSAGVQNGVDRTYKEIPIPIYADRKDDTLLGKLRLVNDYVDRITNFR